MRDAEVCSMRATIAMKDAWTHPCDASMQIMIYCCFACSVVELGGNGMMNRLQAPVDPLGKASDGCWLAQYFACVSTLSACCAERWARIYRAPPATDAWTSATGCAGPAAPRSRPWCNRVQHRARLNISAQGSCSRFRFPVAPPEIGRASCRERV